MFRILIHNWWLVALRSVFALVFGIFVFSVQTAPLTSFLRAMVFTSVVELFGLFAVVVGLLTIAGAIRGFNKDSDWWFLLLDGVGDCIAGLIVVVVPALTIVTLIWIMAIWAGFAGIFELVVALRLRRHVPDEWFLIVAAVGSFVFATVLFLFWSPETHRLLTWLGSYAVFSAITLLALAIRLRRLRGQAHAIAQHAASPQG
jgi:uncharacterized membrane protein HdeD (DUF308 family)